MGISSPARTPGWQLTLVIGSALIWALSWAGVLLFSNGWVVVLCRLISVIATALGVLGLGRRAADWRLFAGMFGLSIALDVLGAALGAALSDGSIAPKVLDVASLLNGNVKAVLCAVAVLSALHRGRGWRLLALSLPVLIWLVLIYVAVVSPATAATVLLDNQPLPAWLDIALHQLTCLALLGFVLAFIDPVREIWRTFTARS